jgi:hypothetical protein
LSSLCGGGVEYLRGQLGGLGGLREFSFHYFCVGVE